MARNMSFAETIPQIEEREKTVTRRLGWTFLNAGDVVKAVKKSMGLKKGEKVETLAILRIEHVRREPLNYAKTESIRRRDQKSAAELEGFGWMTPQEFVDFFCEISGCSPETVVTRIEFSYLDCFCGENATAICSHCGEPLCGSCHSNFQCRCYSKAYE